MDELNTNMLDEEKYFDKNGERIKARMVIKHNEGDLEIVYGYENDDGKWDLGVNASNRKAGYDGEVYPLHQFYLTTEWEIVKDYGVPMLAQLMHEVRKEEEPEEIEEVKEVVASCASCTRKLRVDDEVVLYDSKVFCDHECLESFIYDDLEWEETTLKSKKESDKNDEV